MFHDGRRERQRGYGASARLGRRRAGKARVTTVLITLGRLPKGLDVARGFAAAGCRVIVAEPFAWHLARMSRAVSACFTVPPPSDGEAAYLDALAAICAREAVDVVVPISEETMHVAHLGPRLPPGTRLFTMPPHLVLELHDKQRFIDRAMRLGLAVPRTALLGTAEAEALARAADVIVKPVFSCAGKGVRRLERGTALPVADGPCVVQEFLPGRVVSNCTLAIGGKVRATAVYSGAIMSGTVAIAFRREDSLPQVERWIADFVAGVNWTGFIAFDFIVAEDGTVRAIECNPRTTSGMHFLDATEVARAILDPASTAPVGLRRETMLQQFWACLTETQAAALRGEGWRGLARTLFTTPDVTFRWRDPLPLLTMPATSWKILALAIRRRATFGEVAMLDLGWDPTPGDASANSG